MIGNDIVDLCDPESDTTTLHPRFDRRVFNAEERATVRAAADERRARWSLWAAKEAAYKLARKLDARVAFSPIRFEVALAAPPRTDVGGLRRGRVCHAGGQCFDVEIEDSERWVHAVASRPGATPGSSACRFWAVGGIDARLAKSSDPRLPGRAARALASRRIAKCLGVSQRDLSFDRRGRIPRVLLRGRPAPVDLSLSHHGLFVSFACEFDPVVSWEQVA